MSTESKGSEKELLALISSSVHDMKTPLTSIVGFADAILDGTVPKEKQTHYLRVIRDEADRLERICEELLDASKIESGTRKYEKAPFDICETARRVLISLENRIENKKLNVEFNATDDSIIALGDENAIMRVLYNICDNAVKFSYSEGTLSLDIIEGENDITVKIENSGEGMSDEELRNVFLPFYRKGSGGTGLGMYIAKNIMDAHGTSITAKSEQGKKTAFTFRINRG